jgi:hypothetical protein
MAPGILLSAGTTNDDDDDDDDDVADWPPKRPPSVAKIELILLDTVAHAPV